jgi:hypothetical protein
MSLGLCYSLFLGSGATGFASARERENQPLRRTGGASGTLNSNSGKALVLPLRRRPDKGAFSVIG